MTPMHSTPSISFSTVMQKYPDLPQIPTGKLLARSSPAGMAVTCSGGRWRAAPHLKYLNRKIVDCIQGRSPRLAVQIPIRHGKSELLSVWLPAWYLGEHPENSLIWLSYDQQVAKKYGGLSRNAFERYAPEIWDLTLAQDTHAKQAWNVAGHAGSFYSTSFDGGLGSRAAHGIIIDDPFKNDKQAQTKAERQRVWDAYQNSVYGRLEPEAWMIVASARWHHEDLIGLLLKAALGSDENVFKDVWDLVDQPVYALENDQLGRAPGELLWPERYSKKDIEKRRANMTTRVFAAQLMMRPTDQESEYFPSKFYRYYTIKSGGYIVADNNPIRIAECAIYQCIDLAATEGGGDYFVIGTFARHAATSRIFILDIYRDQIGGPKHIPAMVAAWQKWRPSKIYVESTGMQKMKVEEAQQAGLPVVAFNPSKYGGKLERAELASARYSSGFMFHPGHTPYWLSDLETELSEFPSGRKDQVDVISMACILGAEQSQDYRAAVHYRA